MSKTHTTIAIAIFTAGCSTASADTMIETNPEKEAAQLAVVEARTVHAEAAMAQVMTMAEGASAYMRSEQSYRRDQPWHRIKVFELGGTHSGKDGLPVEWKEYVFPGGPSFTFSSHEQVPVAGTPSPTVGQGVIDDLMLKTFFKLGYRLENESDLRVSYKTGPGEGSAATAVIIVETDIDPSDPANHTVTYELTLDDVSNDIVVANPVVTHAMK